MENILFKKSDYVYEVDSQKAKNRTKFWLWMAGFMALIFVRNIFAIEYPIIILLVYVCCMALFCDHDEIVALAISFVPFYTTFQYRYAILALLVIYALKYAQSLKRINLFVYIPLALMMCWELLHGVFWDFSFVSYLQGFAELIFCTFLISLPNKKFDFSFITRVLAICVIFCCCVLLIKLLQETEFDLNDVFLSGYYRFGVIEDTELTYAISYNANELGYICNLSIIGLLLRVKIEKRNWIDMGLIGALIFFGLLTLSRTFILCLALLILMYIFAFEKDIAKITRGLFSVVIIGALILLILNFTVPFVIENLVARFNDDDVTNGRSDLFLLYGSFVSSSPSNLLFGVGLQDTLNKVSKLDPMIFGVPHNGTEELIVSWGMPGLLLFLYFIVMIISEAKKVLKKHRFANYMPLIMILIVAQAGQLITSGSKLMLLYFAYMVLCTNFSETYAKTGDVNYGRL